jgi:ATP-dependent Clp protease ATP-binding subunit ClpC
MFERFTDRARLVVIRAQEEARALDHEFIGTEHVLLGLIHDGSGVAAEALEALGIDLAALRRKVEEVAGRGGQPSPAMIPFTPRAKTVLELSLSESRALGHQHVGTEHILLGLIRQGDGVAARVLSELGVDLDAARAQVTRLLGEHLRQRGPQTG